MPVPRLAFIISLMQMNEITPQALEAELDKLLPRVTKPGRYTGGELNSVRKDWDQVAVRLALAFPDLYDLGMSNLGMAILYDLVNQRPDMLAERVFSPWTDMETLLRENHLPLYSLESKRPLADFDVIGLSLPYEQLYTNALNLLDLGGIPLLASQRDERHPLVIAGGHAAFNPEPMADFIDAFAIGDGEDVLLEILEVVKQARENRPNRRELLLQLAHIPGVYVPSFYSVSYHADGTIERVSPLTPGLPERVRKRIAAVLPPPPTRPVVPTIATTHNRAMIEIMRGCTRGCRFCQAGFVMRPVRERTVDEVLSAVDQLLMTTGYEEVALLSLSSSDYTNILSVTEAIAERYQNKRLSISLPSLRIESSSADLMEAVSGGRRGSATFAPEAATDKMRRVINKLMPESQIMEVTDEVFSRGWRTIKLYFMIGHPHETLDDIKAIADLAWAVWRQGRQHHGRRARVHLGVSTFIPKPHTPFQWTAVDALDQIRAKQTLLAETTRGKGIELKWNQPEETLFEALLSRGDRRLGPVILHAWQHGAKFDGWREHFDLGRWQAALEAHNLELSFYSHRPRPLEEILPWDHIDTGVRRAYLESEYCKSLTGEIQPDCREGCVSCGILSAFRTERRAASQSAWQCP